MNSGQIRNFLAATAAIAAYTIVKFDVLDGNIVPAAAAADLLMGVSTDIPAAIGDRCDAQLDGICEVLYGGAVTRGQKLTSDASGRAVAAAPGAGANVQIIGTAMVSGVLGDIGQIVISQSVMQG